MSLPLHFFLNTVIQFLQCGYCHILPGFNSHPGFDTVHFLISMQRFLKTADMSRAEVEAFLNEIYVYLVDEMHVAIKKVGLSPPPHLLNWAPVFLAFCCCFFAR